MGSPTIKPVALLVAVLTVPAMNGPVGATTQSEYLEDPRLARLAGFFEESDCPAATLAEDFLSAADRNGLDWRLLPSICLLETGGGKQARNNNLFGWDSGRRCFTSERAGIHVVAERLAQSDLYKGKSLRSKLGTYNPQRAYAVRIEALMRRLGPADP
ncbi:MAG: hypothetical protein FJW34_12975 [Acidobacteria bacterium]|nr:hypothetical protein [Acidobacteriota bacterium]